MNLRQLIRDVQEWLMMEGRCEGCGRLLSQAEEIGKGKSRLIVCECSRTYLYNERNKVYERIMQPVQVEIKEVDVQNVL